VSTAGEQCLGQLSTIRSSLEESDHLSHRPEQLKRIKTAAQVKRSRAQSSLAEFRAAVQSQITLVESITAF
jgi:hypothetical protein